MKKRLTLVLAVFMLLSVIALAACGKSELEEPTGNVTPVTIGNEVFVPDEGDYVFSLRYDEREPLYEGENDFTVLRYTDGGIYASENQEDGMKLCFIPAEGERTYLESYTVLSQNEIPEAKIYPVFLDVASNGSLVEIETASGYIQGKGDNYDYTSACYVRVLDASTGRETSCAKLEGIAGINMNGGAVLCSDGNLIVSDGSSCTAFSVDGRKLKSLSFGKQAVDGLVLLRDGRAGACICDKENKLVVFDAASDGDTKEYALPGEVYADDLVTGSGYYDVCYTSGSYFYGLNLQDVRTDELFNWINAGVVYDELYAVHTNNDGTVSAVRYDYSYYFDYVTVSPVSVLKVPASEDERTVIRVGAVYSEYSLWYRLIDFNSTSPLYRTELVDYSYLNTASNPDGAFEKLAEDLRAGTAPEVIYAGQLDDKQLEKLCKDNLFEDLYPLVDDDIALSRRDYVAEVLSAGEYDGKLITVVPEFSVNAYICRTDKAGSAPGWDKKSLESYAAGFGVSLLPDEKATDEEGNILSDYQQLSQDKCLLAKCEVMSAEDVLNASYYAGGKISLYDLAELNGGESGLVPAKAFAISANSGEKENAWAFVRTFFTEEYQRENSNYLPSNRHALKKLLTAGAEASAAMYPDVSMSVDDVVSSVLALVGIN